MSGMVHNVYPACVWADYSINANLYVKAKSAPQISFPTAHQFLHSGMSQQGTLWLFPPTDRGCTPPCAPWENRNNMCYKEVTSRKQYRVCEHESTHQSKITRCTHTYRSSRLFANLALSGPRSHAALQRPETKGITEQEEDRCLSGMLLYQFGTSLPNSIWEANRLTWSGRWVVMCSDNHVGEQSDR